jgi:hypothetical protein
LESQSSTNRAFALTNNHLWLTYSEAAGIIQPNGKTLALEFEADGKELGTYHDTIVADITDFTKIKLPVEMRVIAPKPDWSVDESDYEASLSIIANINVDSTGMSEDTTNLISAWIDGELRGVDHLRSVGEYHAAYINVAGDESDKDKQIHFRVWLADSGKIYKGHAEQAMHYQPGGLVYGTTPDPRVIRINTTTDEMTFIPLNKGWTWFSLNRDMGDMSTNAVLSSLTPSSGDVIMPLDTATTAEYQLAAGGWIASGLDSLNPSDGYMIHLKEADTLWIWGPVPAKKGYALQNGWNFIGNPYTSPVDINDAFKDPPVNQFSEGEIIRSQNAFAEYQDDTTWQGSLTTLYPNEAYKIKVNAHKGVVFRGGPAGEWEVNPHDYENGMRIAGVIQVDGNEFMDDQSVVGAFIGGECRGTGQLEYIPAMDRFMLSMVVYADQPEQEVKFRIYDGVADTVMDVKATMAFAPGKLTGSYRFPYVFSPSATTGISNLGADGIDPELSISPNPFTSELRLSFVDDQPDEYVVELYNGAGEIFFHRQVGSVKGDNTWTIKPGKRLASGMYYVTVKHNGTILETFKVVKE